MLLYFILYIATMSTLLYAEDTELISTLPEKAIYFNTDNLQNSYIITPQNELIKYDVEGKELASYSTKKYGTLDHIDCSNPLKIVLIFPDFAQIVITDNYLSPQRQINLSELNIERCTAACLSYDNQIWVYDERAYKLRKINNNLNITESSEDLSSLISPELDPNFLISKDKQLYLNDSSRGIFIFDIYGQFEKRLPIEGLQHFQVIDKKIYYYKDNKLLSYNTNTLAHDTLYQAKHPDIKDAQIRKDHLYLLRKQRLMLYQR